MNSNNKNEKLENAFCFAAYVLTFLTLTIDVVFSHYFKEGACGASNEMLVCHATAIAIILCAILGIALYKKTLPSYFEAANESLPTLTMFAYLLYYPFKSGCFLYNDFLLFSMYPLVPLGYLLICVCTIRKKYILYKKDKQSEEKQKKNNELENEYTFCADRPISSVSEDLLKRGSFSKLLAETIAKLNKDDTFTVGVFGKWGSGKTSVVKMMLNELDKQQSSLDEDEKTIFVHFEPWNFTDTNQLLNQFFARLSNEFKQKDDDKLKSIGNALEEYSKAFTLAELIPNIGFWGKIISFFGENAVKAVGKYLKKDWNSEDIQKQKEEIVDSLKEQSCKILVVIDDIDRLSNEQIRYIFQLVTSVAKFPNTIYLLVFDKDIVVKALEQVQEGSGEDYLEKVIQMPIEIPDIQTSALMNIMLEKLTNVINHHHDTIISGSYWNDIYLLCVNPFIKTIRDVNRICNAVEFKLSAISGEVDFADIVALTTMEMKKPMIYKWIRENKSILTGYGISLESIKSKTSQEWYELYEQRIMSTMPLDNMGSSKKQAILILTCLSQLFPYFGKIIGKSYTPLSQDILMKDNHVSHPEKFDRYFHLTPDYIKIKKSEIISAIETMSSNEIVDLLLEKDKEDLSYEFIEEIKASAEDINSKRAKVLINALLQVTQQMENRPGKNILSISVPEFNMYTTYNLFKKIPTEERKQYIIDAINTANCDVFVSLAEIINILELAHGRLSANGQERSGFSKILNSEELLDIESVFMSRTKELLKETSLFLFKKWKIVLHLMENFDSKFTSEYMLSELTNDENIIRFIEGSVERWIGHDVTYKINNEYTKYSTKERVLQAIQNLKKFIGLRSYPEAVTNASVAFFLYEEKNMRDPHEISQQIINRTLLEWLVSKKTLY